MNVRSTGPIFWGIVSTAMAAVCIVESGPAQERERQTRVADFSAAAGNALDAMVKEAKSRGMKGVAVVAFVPGDEVERWCSQMRVVDAFVQNNANLLAIAHCKLCEMADTLKDSGSKVRPPLHGELGYRGGAIRRLPTGYILAAFSGGKDADDLVVATIGLDSLEKAVGGSPGQTE